MPTPTAAPTPLSVSADDGRGTSGGAAPDWATAYGELLRATAPAADATADQALEHTADVVDANRLRAGYRARLDRRLAGLAARTLVRDLHRSVGTLSGGTPSARFDDHVARLASGRLTDLLEEHPVLAELVAAVAADHAAAFVELLERWTGDRAALERLLPGGPGALVDVAVAGDVHGGGRAVAVLTGADGRRVVYKPRPVALQARFGELVDWFNTRTRGLTLRTPQVVDRGTHGWVEFVAAESCSDAAGVHRFFRRQGSLLALLYALDGTDVHFENLIAAGEDPVVIDVETLFHPALAPARHGGSDPAADALADSVCRTALLPTLLLADDGAADVSALGADEGASLPVLRAEWAAAGTDRMHLVRRPGRLPRGEHRVRLSGRAVEPSDHVPALQTGFREGYDALLRHRAELLADGGPLRAAADAPVRVVVRPTAVYSHFLDESTHPDLLRVPADRTAYLAEMGPVPAAATLGDLQPAELAELYRGDVPAFGTTAGSRTMYDARGAVATGRLPASGLAVVAAKLGRLSEADRGAQDWLIAAACACRSTEPVHRGVAAARTSGYGRPATRSALLAAATGIGDRLLAGAHHDTRGRANWIGLEPVDERQWALLALGAGLPHGHLGVALFLAELGRLTGAARHTDLARAAVRTLPALLAGLADDIASAQLAGPGQDGLGGIAYGTARLAGLLADAEMAAATARVTALVGRLATEGHAGGPTFATGDAGALVAMLAVAALTGDPAADAAADAYAARLSGDLDTTAGLAPGFARGRDGVSWARQRWSRLRAGSDRRPADSLRPSSAPWCLRPVHSDPAGTASDALDDLSLCHGEFGRLDPLLQAAADGDTAAATDRDRRLSLVLGRLDRDGPVGGAPGRVRTPALFTGLAGIGYGLVRAVDPHGIPSVLLMDVPATPARPTPTPARPASGAPAPDHRPQPAGGNPRKERR